MFDPAYFPDSNDLNSEDSSDSEVGVEATLYVDLSGLQFQKGYEKNNIKELTKEAHNLKVNRKVCSYF